MKSFNNLILIAIVALSVLCTTDVIASESIEIPVSKARLVVYSDKADLLAFRESYRTVKVYSAKTKKLVAQFTDSSRINDIAFNPNGSRILTGHDDNTRKIWNTRTGKLINTLKGQKGDVNAVAYSPNGKLAASAAEDRTIRIWDPIITKGLRTIKTEEQVRDLQFLGNNRDLALTTYDGIEIWNARTGKRTALFESPRGYSKLIANRKGSIIAAVGYGRLDEYVHIWDVSKKKKLHTLMGHKDTINGLAFSADEKIILTTSDDDSAGFYEVETGVRHYQKKFEGDYVASVITTNHPQQFWIAHKSSFKRYQVAGLDPKFRKQFALAEKKATTAQQKFDTFLNYQGLLLIEDVEKLLELFHSSYQMASDKAIAGNDYKTMFQVFEKYQRYAIDDKSKKLGVNLYQQGMKSHFKDALKSNSSDEMYNAYKSYGSMKYNEQQVAIVKQFILDAMKWLAGQNHLSFQAKFDEFNRWNEITPAVLADATLEAMRELAKVDIRNVFKEGKIGERYVPILNVGTSSTKTRYINGNPINETTYDSYSTGGHNESRYGYTSVYQLFNEAKEYYLIDLEINATSSFTNYKTGKSWGGDERRTSVSKESRISQVTQYLLRPGANVKDQLIVGEKIPKDYFLKVKSVRILPKEWVEGLDRALSGKHLLQTMKYMKDPLAYNWLPELGATFAGESYRLLTHSISVGQKFDKDFDSNVKVEFSNQNNHAVLVTYTTNFDSNTSAKSHQIKIPGNSKKHQSIVAKGKRKSRLKIEYQMIEPSN